MRVSTDKYFYELKISHLSTGIRSRWLCESSSPYERQLSYLLYLYKREHIYTGSTICIRYLHISCLWKVKVDDISRYRGAGILSYVCRRDNPFRPRLVNWRRLVVSRSRKSDFRLTQKHFQDSLTRLLWHDGDSGLHGSIEVPVDRSEWLLSMPAGCEPERSIGGYVEYQRQLHLYLAKALLRPRLITSLSC